MPSPRDAVASPVGKERGRRAGVADHGHVRSRIAQPQHGVGVEQHLAHLVEAAAVVVLERVVQKGPAAIGDQEVERKGQGATAFGPGTRGDARGGVGLVIRRRADLEGALEHLEHAPAPLVGAGLGEALAPCRLGEPGHALGQLEGGDVLVRRVGEEGMQARVEPHHHADGPRADLPGDGQPVAPRLADVGEGASPEPGVLVDLQEQHRERSAGDLDHAPQHGPVAADQKSRRCTRAHPRRRS